ncbi:hypothetical protein [Salinarchaeum laminariae]|uniref:hypothetical protein n=1 Tax=Salinarchaeum laminariae TaxID=869888 RepID=UPI0020BF24E4|nr:hypothetical protein [Salinarchaeum laminariae]
MYAVILVVGTAAGAYAGYRLGGVVVGDGSVFGVEEFPLEVVGGIAALLWLVVTVIFVTRAVGERGTLAQPEAVLTIVPTWEALVGVYVAECAYVAMWVLGPAAGAGAGLAVGTGALTPVVAVPVALLLAGWSTVAVGYPVGLTVRHVALRFPFVARHKSGVVVAAFLVYFVLISAGALNEAMVTLFEPMQSSPMAWFADLAFLGTPGVDASPVQAVGAAVFAVVVVGVGVVAGTRVADTHWFSDPVLAGEEPEESVSVDGSGASSVEEWIEGVFGRRTGTLIVVSWRRVVRAPMKVLYAFFPVFFITGMVAEIVQTGDVPAFFPYLVVVIAAWAAGVIFTLNPLGDQGAVLTSTLLSGVDGRTFVHAHMIAGLVVAIPIGTVVTGVLAVLSPVETRTVVALTAATPVLMVLAAVVSVGIGMAFPRFDEVNVTRSMTTVLPSRWAFVLFTAYLFLTAAAAGVTYEEAVRELAAVLLSFVLPFGIDVAPGTLFSASVVVLAVAVVAPVVAYRSAVRRFDEYTLA